MPDQTLQVGLDIAIGRLDEVRFHVSSSNILTRELEFVRFRNVKMAIKGMPGDGRVKLARYLAHQHGNRPAVQSPRKAGSDRDVRTQMDANALTEQITELRSCFSWRNVHHGSLGGRCVVCLNVGGSGFELKSERAARRNPVDTGEKRFSSEVRRLELKVVVDGAPIERSRYPGNLEQLLDLRCKCKAIASHDIVQRLDSKAIARQQQSTLA